MKSLSRVQLLVTPWTVAYQAPSSMGFSRQEYWSGGTVAFSISFSTFFFFFFSFLLSFSSSFGIKQFIGITKLVEDILFIE